MRLAGALIKMHKYSYTVNTIDGSSGALIMQMIRPGSRVLDVGAGPGSITRLLVEHLGCTVVAIENDPTAIPLLRETTQRIFELDLNASRWADAIALAEEPFDYVVAADVLEHLVDPVVAMGEMRSLLAPRGSIILSLPNIGHAAIAACLWDDDFAYQDWGLLDRTHIRFFGIKNIQELACAHGMAIEEARFVVRHPAYTEFTAQWDRLPFYRRMLAMRRRFANVYQVVTRSAPLASVASPVELIALIPPRPSKVPYPFKKLWKMTKRHIKKQFADRPNTQPSTEKTL